MNKKNQVEKNIELAFDFIKKVINNPAVLDKIEDNSIVNIADRKPSSNNERKIQKRKLTDKNKLAHTK